MTLTVSFHSQMGIESVDSCQLFRSCEVFYRSHGGEAGNIVGLTPMVFQAAKRAHWGITSSRLHLASSLKTISRSECLDAL